jgi:glycosyltransferase involved in cell wall biosynthesis
MIICIPTLKNDPKTGKDFFCARLANQLIQYNIKIINDPQQKHDITLNMVELNKSKGKLNIVRLDGVYFNTQGDYKTHNKIIANSLHKSDAVIYQSKFGLKLCNRYLGEFKGPKTIIHNGANPDYYKNIKPIQSDYEYKFITVSRWRPHKRLQDIIESYLLADIKNSCLYIAGNIKNSGLPNKYPNNIIFLGQLNQEELASYLITCKALIHLCWIDCCPNSVVEAITAKIPVITNNVGGTKELVAPSGGIVCDIDEPFDLEPCKLYNPPKINRIIIAEAIKRTIQEKIIIENKYITIDEISKQYLNFFESLLNK